MSKNTTNAIFNIADIDIPEWQEIIDFISEWLDVPSAVITFVNNDDVNIVAASSNKENPFVTGDQAHFTGEGYYCESVVKSGQDLLVSNGLLDSRWKDGPNAKIGLISYLGLPIFFPDGTAFGTICILDSKENHFSVHFKKLLEKFRNLFQKHIESHIYTIQLNEEIRKRKVIEEDLEKTVKQRTAELEKAKQAAEKADKVKSEFLSYMSHEFRTPLHGILSFADFGIRNIEVAPREKNLMYYSRISESGNRLLDLVNNLLDLSKLEAGRIDFDIKRVNFDHIISSSIAEIQVLADQKKIKIIYKSLPINSEIYCDELRITQVLNNLLSNAIKFSPDGTNVNVNASEDNITDRRQNDDQVFDAMLLTVSDEGPGILENELKTIFDKFTQSHNKSPGTGLGLAICKDIVEGHEGKIQAENVSGGGAKFSVFLPKRPQSNY